MDTLKSNLLSSAADIVPIDPHSTNPDPERASDVREQLSPAPKVADQFGITRRTLSRWMLDQDLHFPRAVEINKRLYFKQREIDDWKLSRCRRGVAA